MGVRRRHLRAVTALALLATAVVTLTSPQQGEAALVYEDFDPSIGPLGPITVIGDSVMVGSILNSPTVADQLVAHGWGPVRVRAGRGTSTGYFGVTSEARASFWIERWRSQGWDSRDYVVNLGANDSGFCERSISCARAAITHLADTIGPGHRIWWAKATHIPALASWANNWNTALDQIAAERENFVVWDWPTIMANGPFPSHDNIHISPSGYRLRSQLIAADVTATYGVAERVGGDAPLPEVRGDPTRFLPLTTTRVIDTRIDPPGRLTGDSTLTVDVSDHVPDGTTAVAAYVVAIDAAGPGFLTAYECALGRPLAASTNYDIGHTRGAVDIVPIADDGTFCVDTHADADVVVDLQGAFLPAHPDALGFEPLPQPIRLADSRLEGGPRHLTVVAAPAGADGVAINVTAVEPPWGGYVIAYPCTEGRPLGATVNYLPGDVVGGGAFVPVGSDGTVCVWSVIPIDVTVDLVGTFVRTGGLSYVPAVRTRMIDTRDGTGGWWRVHGAGQTIDARVAPPGAGAVSGSLTIASPVNNGYLRAWACAAANQTASVNAVPRAVLTNSLISRIDSNGRMCLFSSAVSSSIFDVSGWWVSG